MQLAISSYTTSDNFSLSNTSEEKIWKIKKNIDNSKAAGINELSSRFIKDTVNILTKPFSTVLNFLISQGVFSNA